LADGVEQKRIRNQWAPARRGRTEFGDDAIAIRDQHGFTAGRQADVFAELILKQFDPDRPHTIKVATGSYFVSKQIRPLHALAPTGQILFTLQYLYGEVIEATEELTGCGNGARLRRQGAIAATKRQIRTAPSSPAISAACSM
jgi:hypothetical protein